MKNLEYPCDVTTSADGDVVVTFPDIPEAITGGDSRDDALALAPDCLSVALTFYLEQNAPLPRPSRPKRAQVTISPTLQIALKAALLESLRESGERPADLARKMGIDHKSVRRILDPNHNSHLDRLEQALSVVGKRVTLTTSTKTTTTVPLHP